MSIKDSLSKYIEERNKLIKEFNENIKQNDKEWIDSIRDNCPIKIGDVFSRPARLSNTSLKYYIVSDIKISIDGTVSVSGHRLTNKHLWAKNWSYLFSTSIYTNFESNSGFNKVVGNELTNIMNKVSNADNSDGIIHEAIIANE